MDDTSAAEALDSAIARLALDAATVDEVLTLATAYRLLADSTDDESDKDEEPKPIHATTDPQMIDVGTSFWSEDRRRMGFRPGGMRGLTPESAAA